MSAPQRNCDEESYSSAEYESAFEIAKQTLRFVGEFKTPPTPDVYEFWYRYAEGKDEAFSEKVAFLVEDLKLANRRQINELRDQFLNADSLPDHQSTVGELLASLAGVKSIIQTQAEAGEQFDGTLRAANLQINQAEPSAQQVRQCMDDVLASNQAMQEQLAQMRMQLDESQNQIEGLRDHLHESQRNMMTDPLTGVGNRRFFNSLLQSSMQHPDRGTRKIFLLLVDLDKFKQINDTFGHDSGDAVVKHISSELEKLAGNASVARFGGDEFAIFLNADGRNAGKELAESIADSVSAMNFKQTRTGQSIGRLSVSIGVALLRPDDDSETWFKRADELLYRVKQGGGKAVLVDRSSV